MTDNTDLQPTAFESIHQADRDDVAEAYPPMEGWRKGQCDQWARGYFCGREDGHTGPHVAYEPLARAWWPGEGPAK